MGRQPAVCPDGSQATAGFEEKESGRRWGEVDEGRGGRVAVVVGREPIRRFAQLAERQSRVVARGRIMSCLANVKVGIDAFR